MSGPDYAAASGQGHVPQKEGGRWFEELVSEGPLWELLSEQININNQRPKGYLCLPGI